MYVITSYVQIFLINIIIFLLLTLIIACITLMERKILSLVQRRVGPNYVGYKGRLQFIADALKLLTKHIIIISKVNKFFYIIIPNLILIICYFFWLNLVWAPNLTICEIEYNLLFMSVLSIIFSSLLLIIGWVTKNKYAILSSSRVLVVVLNLEILLTFLITYLTAVYESFSFYQIVSFQHSWTWSILLFLPLTPVLLIVFFLETSRIPFDLTEAESELIAGYTTEMSGFFFALFYLGEYFHLFCFSFTYVLIFFGGWHINCY